LADPVTGPFIENLVKETFKPTPPTEEEIEKKERTDFYRSLVFNHIVEQTNLARKFTKSVFFVPLLFV
jgi:hypothetical protein